MGRNSGGVRGTKATNSSTQRGFSTSNNGAPQRPDIDTAIQTEPVQYFQKPTNPIKDFVRETKSNLKANRTNDLQLTGNDYIIIKMRSGNDYLLQKDDSEWPKGLKASEVRSVEYWIAGGNNGYRGTETVYTNNAVIETERYVGKTIRKITRNRS